MADAGSTDHDDDAVRASTAAIIGADVAQVAQHGSPIPPPPQIGVIGQTYLWVVAFAALTNAVVQFASGHIGLGMAGLVGGLLGFGIRYAIVSSYHRSRWRDDPAYRHRYLHSVRPVGDRRDE